MEGGGEVNDGGGAITDGLEVDGSDAVAINIRCSGITKFVVQVSFDSSVDSFKSVIAKNCDVPAEQQRLIYKGRLLKDGRTLQSYDLEAEHTVHLVRPHLPATINLCEFPELKEIQQPWIHHPRISQSTLEQLITDPEALRNMVMSNPQLREIINRDPVLARAFNDPVIFRTIAGYAIIWELVTRYGGGGDGDTPRHSAVTDRSAPGGLEIRRLEGMLGFTPDPVSMSRFMRSPAISQLIRPFFSDPQNSNLILHPQFSEILHSPFLTSQSQLTSPATMQKRMALHQSPSYLFGEQQSSRGEGQTSGRYVSAQEVHYAYELAELEEMGFLDTPQNLEALAATEGNVSAAVDRLRGGQ